MIDVAALFRREAKLHAHPRFEEALQVLGDFVETQDMFIKLADEILQNTGDLPIDTGYGDGKLEDADARGGSGGDALYQRNFERGAVMNTRLLHMAAPDDPVVECPDCGDPIVLGELCSCYAPHPTNCTCEDCGLAEWDPQRDVAYPSRAGSFMFGIFRESDV